MKKTMMLFIAIVAISVSSFSQEEAQKNEFKPNQGMSALEVTFKPAAIFNANSPGAMFELPSIGGLNQGIKWREWHSDNFVTRGTFLFGIKNFNDATVLFNSVGGRVDAKDTYFEWALQFRPGVERHFAGTKRLSPYLGGELILGFGSNKYTSESLNASDEIQTSTVKNGSNTFDGKSIYWSYANGFSIGAGLLAGFDYYVAKNLYLGLEINYAFVYNKANKVVTEIPNQETIETKTGSNWYFNPSTGASLRLGWAF